MKIAIVGAGAVGSYYGARLAAAGHHVHFLLRSDFDHVSQHGMEVKSVDGDFSLETINCSRTSEEIGEVELVIVAWKTTSNHHAKEIISPLIGVHTRILTLQNGLGNVEWYGQLFGSHRVMGGLCFVCINRISPGMISHSASGLIRLAWVDRSMDDFSRELVEAFTEANILCEGIDNLEQALWMKLVWNFPFNGLAIAEGGVDTQVLLKERGLEPLVRDIMHEVISVGRALGHDIPYAMIDQQIDITTPMGPYKPSSMIDYMAGRPVEYQAIWQQPLEVAERVGVAVPRMAQLAQRIKTLLDQTSQ